MRMFPIRRLATVLPVLALLLLAGCVQAPDQFRVLRVEKPRMRADHLDLRFVCSVHNPNGSRLDVRDLTARLRVEGIDLGQLEPVARIQLAGRKSTEFTAGIAVPYRALLQLAPLVLTRSQFRVEIDGQCRAGTWYTFRHRVHHSQFLTVDVREALYKQLLEALKKKPSTDVD